MYSVICASPNDYYLILNTKAVILLSHFLYFCFPTFFIGKRGWRREQKVTYRRRRQYKVIFESFLRVAFSICSVRKKKCHCWTLPSIPVAEVENGA